MPGGGCQQPEAHTKPLVLCHVVLCQLPTAAASSRKLPTPSHPAWPAISPVTPKVNHARLAVPCRMQPGQGTRPCRPAPNQVSQWHLR